VLFVRASSDRSGQLYLQHLKGNQKAISDKVMAAVGTGYALAGGGRDQA